MKDFLATTVFMVGVVMMFVPWYVLATLGAITPTVGHALIGVGGILLELLLVIVMNFNPKPESENE